MEFSLEQRFDAAPDVVAAAYVDPGFLTRLGDLPGLGGAEVLATARTGGVVRQKVRYRFVAEVSAAVRRVVDPERLTWVEEGAHDLTARSTAYVIAPDHYANLLAGEYEADVLAHEGGALRNVRGTVKVHVPLVGGRVERAIVGGLRDAAVAHPGVLESWLADRA